MLIITNGEDICDSQYVPVVSRKFYIVSIIFWNIFFANTNQVNRNRKSVSQMIRDIIRLS